MLTVNSGSSSIKFALFDGPGQQRIVSGQVERIGLPDARFHARSSDGTTSCSELIDAATHEDAVAFILQWLAARRGLQVIDGVGHRVVHGGARLVETTLVDDLVVEELRRLVPLAPNHLPGEIAAIEALRRHSPGLPQFACFDTAFHRHLPQPARQIALPRRYAAAGVRRYGFHGLSYAYLLRELERTDGADAASGRVVFAHLGSGCSLAAVHKRRCVDTTMGFTPAAGLVMATRTGDVDPGLIVYLLREEQLSVDALDRLVNRESGLLGVSGLSSDVRDLLAAESTHAHAAEALELFCYQLRKWIGACAAALSGLDTLVFSAGIGENSPEIRARVCDGLGFLGVTLDAPQNAANAPVISAPASRVRVRVIRTDEEAMIVAEVHAQLGRPAMPGNAAV